MSGPTAGLLAGFGLRPKRKALADQGKGSHKVARKDSTIRKAQSVFGEDSSEDSEDYEDKEEDASEQVDAVAEEDVVVLVEEEDAESDTGDNTNQEEDANEEEDMNQQEEFVEVGAENDKVRFTTSVSTKDRGRNQRPAQLRLAATSSIAASKKVISFNPETLRQGFLAGGAKLTDGKLASSALSE